MCDEHTLEDDRRQSEELRLSRRRFGMASGGLAAAKGAGLSVTGVMAAWLPNRADASVALDGLAEREVEIATPEGTADAFFVHPVEGAHAAVLVWPDILGLREAYRLVGRRLAAAGYTALVVNPYYRSQKAPVVQPGASFQDEATRNLVLPLARSLSAKSNVVDSIAFVDWLDQQPEVDTKRKIGTIGYCMGGAITMRAAAAIPGRIGAGASFHGGRLVTDDLESPHRLVPLMNASFLIAVAANDDERDPVAKSVLRQAFDAAELDAEIEVYAGAMHGWCTPDSRAYDEEKSERAWARMMAKFAEALA